MIIQIRIISLKILTKQLKNKNFINIFNSMTKFSVENLIQIRFLKKSKIIAIYMNNINMKKIQKLITKIFLKKKILI